jgi:archaellum biogenesis protein FlaJ (TadC family)
VRRSTLIAIVLSWAVYVVVCYAAIMKASQTPGVDGGKLVGVIALGTVGMVLIHSGVAERDRRRER